MDTENRHDAWGGRSEDSYREGFAKGYGDGYRAAREELRAEERRAEREREQREEAARGGWREEAMSGGRLDEESPREGESGREGQGCDGGYGYGYNYGGRYEGGYRREEYEPCEPGCSEGFRRNDPFASGPEGKCRGAAALFAIFLGCLGVQYFYLGKLGGGVLAIVISLLLTVTIVLSWVPPLVWFVQGIVMFCMSNADFRRKFVLTRSSFPMF